VRLVEPMSDAHEPLVIHTTGSRAASSRFGAWNRPESFASGSSPSRAQPVPSQTDSFPRPHSGAQAAAGRASSAPAFLRRRPAHRPRPLGERRLHARWAEPRRRLRRRHRIRLACVGRGWEQHAWAVAGCDLTRDEWRRFVPGHGYAEGLRRARRSLMPSRGAFRTRDLTRSSVSASFRSAPRFGSSLPSTLPPRSRRFAPAAHGHWHQVTRSAVERALARLRKP
jgi:hypothetical protein